MTIVIESVKVGNIFEVTKPAIKIYRESPGDLEKAINAAFHYVKSQGLSEIFIVKGNSYMHSVYQIYRSRNKCFKSAPFPIVDIYVVREDGEIHQERITQ